VTTSADPHALLSIASEAAHAAGTLLLDRFGGPVSGLSAKSTRTDLVSDADRDAEAIILGRIRSARPDDLVIAEESGTSAGQHDGVRWHVDPLDGTVNYLWNIPHWAVSIHAENTDGDLAAVVYDPCRNELFTAVPGECHLNGARLELEPADELAMALLATGFAYNPVLRARQAEIAAGLIGVVRDVRRNGSAALDLAWVAAGRLDLYYERGLAIWDSAAGAMLVREAHGVVAPLGETAQLPDGLLAGRPGISDELLTLLRRSE
jgi:myo-inositol-1(or 4)-monophosphatase